MLIPSKDGYTHEDALFMACALVLVAGFLISPPEESDRQIANSLLFVSKLAFGVLSYAVLAALCTRNPVGSIMFLACGELANAGGILIGAELGELCNHISAIQPKNIGYMASAIVLTFLPMSSLGCGGSRSPTPFGESSPPLPSRPRTHPPVSQPAPGTCL